MYDNNYPNGYSNHTGNQTGGAYGQNPYGQSEGQSSYRQSEGQTSYGQNAGQTSYGQGAGRNHYENAGDYRASAGNYHYGSAYPNTYAQAGQKKERKAREKKPAGYLRKALVAVSLGLFFGLFAGLGLYIVEAASGMLDKDPVEISESADGTNLAQTETAGDIQEQGAKDGALIRQSDTVTAVVTDVTDVVEKVMPSIVAVNNHYTETMSYWGQSMSSEADASGSGIIVGENDTELLIVTNYHVVEDNNNLYVQFIDDAEATAYVKGTSPENDLAIVSVFLEDMADDTLESIAIAALGDSDSLQVGEPAIAIGDSLGYGQSVTTGVISALNRNVFADDPDTIPEYLIQTDAAINPGNSGGALLNVKGEVVGINSSKIADYVIEGMGYAIPISTAKPIIEDLMQRETRRKVPEEERAFLGIAGTDVIEEATARYEMPEGVYVSNVLEDTAADDAGILKGDIIMYIDGEKIEHMEELQGMLEYYAAGTEVEVVLMRQSNGEYKERIVNVMLGYKE